MMKARAPTETGNKLSLQTGASRSEKLPDRWTTRTVWGPGVMARARHRKGHGLKSQPMLKGDDMRNFRLALMVALLAVFAVGVLSAENPSSEQGKPAPAPFLSAGQCKVAPAATGEITM